MKFTLEIPALLNFTCSTFNKRREQESYIIIKCTRKMKKGSLFLIMVMVSVSAFAQKQFTINGTTPDKYNGSYVYISPLDIESPINTLPTFTDSVFIKNGKFIFKGELQSDTSLYWIALNKTSGGFVTMDTEQLNATYIEGDPFGYFRISGSALNDNLTRYIEYPKEMTTKIADYMKDRAELLAKNEWTLEDEAAFEENHKMEVLDYLDFISNLVRDNISNPVGQYILVTLGGNIKSEVMDEINPKLSANVRRKLKASKESMAEMMKAVQAPASIENALRPGDKYIDFEGEIFSGEKVMLSSVINLKKLVLLDFWATWCVPCLKEMPEIAKLYDKYKDKDFEIIGISIDKNRGKWRSMIEGKGMPWLQFIDSNMSNPISNMYEVTAIPHTVLIDENGEIIAVNLRGEELRKKIEGLLSE